MSKLLKALRPQVRSGGLHSLCLSFFLFCLVTPWLCELAVRLPVSLRDGVDHTGEAPGLAPVTRNCERGPIHVAAPVETLSVPALRYPHVLLRGALPPVWAAGLGSLLRPAGTLRVTHPRA